MRSHRWLRVVRSVRNLRVPTRDLAVLSGIPVVIAALHFGLPVETRYAYALSYENPALVTVWTHALLHSSTPHLLSNLAGYGVITMFTYGLYMTVLNDRSGFWTAFITVFLITPLVTIAGDFLTLYPYFAVVDAETVTRGFSGIVSGIIGLHFTALTCSIAQDSDWATAIHTATLLVLTALTVLVVGNDVLTYRTGTSLIVGFIAVSIATASHTGIGSLQRATRSVSTHRTVIGRVVLHGGVSVLFAWFLFPFDVMQDGGFINIFAHFTGVSTGIVVAALLHQYQ